jgi:hypothetical protein
MDAPADDPEGAAFITNITIPSALIRKSLGDKIKDAITKGMVQVGGLFRNQFCISVYMRLIP